MLNVASMTPDFAIDVRGVTKKFGARTVVNNIAMQAVSYTHLTLPTIYSV